MLFQLIYREHQQVQSGLIEAGSLAKAEELGRGWCDGKAGRRYVAVRDAVLCREEVGKLPAVEAAVRQAGGK